MELTTFGIVLFCFGISLLLGVIFFTLIRDNIREKKQEA
jgi:hypothetical protein